MRVLLILTFISFIFSAKVLLPKKIIYAVDCGSPVDKHASIGVKF